jgi:hypothetical protein
MNVATVAPRPGRRPGASRRNARPGFAATDDGEVRAERGAIVIIRRYLSLKLETAIALIVGFALGYGVREWVFRQYRRAEQRRRRPF